MAQGSLRDSIATRWRVYRARGPRGTRAFVWHPQPRDAGLPRRGGQIRQGIWHLAGQVLEAPLQDPWTLTPPSTPFEMQLHGFGWLDDLMSLGDREAADLARQWVLSWLRQFGRGKGPGWSAALTGRRLLRFICHAPILLGPMARQDQALLFDAFYRQTAYLRRTHGDAPAGLPQMEALTALVYAGLTLEGWDGLSLDAADAMAAGLAEDISYEGGIASRNPEALLEIASLLDWAVQALGGAGQDVPQGLTTAQTRMIPTLRSLRHADGSLARFHGGGPGASGRLDRVLTSSGSKTRNENYLVMGYISLRHGRTSLIVDAAQPPTGRVSGSAHASTLAFEMTSGPCPLIVNCGPGGAYGADWHRAGRATPSHSTLTLDGRSSSQIGPLIQESGRRIAPLVDIPKKVQWQRSSSQAATTVFMAHDGFVPAYGLAHLRRLVLSNDGRKLEGEESLRAVSTADKAVFDTAQTDKALQGVPYHLRFHLHPDAQAQVDMGGRAVSILLPSGEVWIFRPGRQIEMRIEASVYLEAGRLKPRPSQQLVLSDRIVTYAATITWTL
ncbi:MAG: heparinase II/III family protein, partial [Pseudomonadota bacterium]